MTMPAVPQDSIEFLERVLRAFDSPTNSAVSVLFQAAEREDRLVIEAVHEHLANLMGLSLVAAQVLINGRRSQRPLEKGSRVRHPWLTDVEFIDAIANFWKHHGQWREKEWATVEGRISSRAEVEGAKQNHRTPAQLAGLGVSRGKGSENMFILAKAVGFSDASWDWLLDPLRTWWE